MVCGSVVAVMDKSIDSICHYHHPAFHLLRTVLLHDIDRQCLS